MVALNSKFDILRGWPNSSAVQEDFIIGGDVNNLTHPHKQGTWVSLDSSVKDGSMVTSDTSLSSGFGQECYLIIEGRDDFSSRFANRVTCLLGGGYVVRIPEEAVDAEGGKYKCLNTPASEFAPGDLVKVQSNALSKVSAGAIGQMADIDGIDDQNPANLVADEVASMLNTTKLALSTLLEQQRAVGKVLAVDTNANTIDILVF